MTSTNGNGSNGYSVPQPRAEWLARRKEVNTTGNFSQMHFAARKLKAGSEFGRMLDPIADKVLVAVALMMLVAEGTFARPTTGTLSLLRLVPALIILSREILVSGLREFLAGTRVSVPVTAIAKIKTAVQMVAIGAMILTPLADTFLPILAAEGYSAVAYVLLWIAAALTVYTGVIYFKNGLTYIRPGHAPVEDRT